MSAGTPPSVGQPGAPAAVRSLRFDDVVVTYVVDGVVTLRPDTFFPTVPDEFWSTRPELCTPAGELLMSAGGLLVERDGRALLIDAGVGSRTSEFVFGRVDCGSMIDVLDALGRRPENIDTVAFTHLHFDHSGWAFADGAKVFPNARYVLSAREWSSQTSGRHLADETIPRHVIDELAARRSELDLIDDGEEIAPGVRALATPGHTPGHTSYVVTSRSGSRLVVLGDTFHSPIQLARPEWLSAADHDAPRVRTARARLLAELAEPDTVAFGFHFGDQPFGRLNRDEATGAAGWEPVPTRVLAPPPR